MLNAPRRAAVACGVLLALAGAGARAQLAVIDVASLQQLLDQARSLAQQLATARAQLSELQSQYRSTIGDRGMRGLLAGSARNYLPTDWAELDALTGGFSDARFAALGSSYRGALAAEALLPAAGLAALAPAERAQIAEARSRAALLQALSAEELTTFSARFTELQRLIDAMAAATDQKGVLDLQARIGAEQTMLQNDQSKIQALYQGALAGEWALRQRERERVIAGQGQFSARFEPSPP